MKDPVDTLIGAADDALRALFSKPHAMRPTPRSESPLEAMEDEDRRKAGALMRVNHVGEICAQAMYAAQAATTRDPHLKAHFQEAAREELDHLAWTQERLDELGSRASFLNPLWYAGAFGIGLLAGRFGDPVSLGFVAETERQVEAHLDSHLDRLPQEDTQSRAIVQQMKVDEARHAAQAQSSGAKDLPPPAKALMRLAARVMTTVAHRV
ncbi:MAG: 2-polyprenyl-3-methyl-6-methoxy-1,4-benzoquinone monooxygenase [Gammaproteobacteria bacterium]|nr:2-polyprenyl-3-methyl-6-methoxy-1,4-benzoquinone monooxygenase [Gammaproteobacteria bacterium]MBU1442338.1 2-polyprenyl-3-methyl-6-methoxy-1,4-benzoquinone monooxygenase [Gammaproteobacteria bacterium]MBU2286473.1 2-polyprenyl-3-methyl-6-methoxy-1,4-benzoquinone monooxygenase [Gammaproteobacteria bacterium]MBU2410087.1 2-polyprenyl-3-methyl-6-methoxy-1,4-benzoquinone monooxygenase [Gammaproteobacteria bacterium]